MAAGDIMLDLRDIHKSFFIDTPNEFEVLHGVNFSVREGEFVSIVGQSGSGKSTLMNIIGALDRPTSGEYTLDGVDIEKAKDHELSILRNKKIGFVFQKQEEVIIKTGMNVVEEAKIKAVELAYDKMNTSLLDDEYIIDYKVLDSRIIDKGVELRIFFSVLENVGEYQSIPKLKEVK